MKIRQYDLSLGRVRPRQGSHTTYHSDGTAGTILLYGSKIRNKDETAVTFTAQDEGLVAGDHRFKDSSSRKGKTFDGIDVSILGRLKRSPGREHFARVA